MGTIKGRCPVCKIVAALVIIGAVNWGLIGALQYNLVDHLLGEASMIGRIVYGLVGVAGLITLIGCFKECPCKCSKPA